ncbi:hypothetical protein GINT2_000620 [Glugoides intestinalis]
MTTMAWSSNNTQKEIYLWQDLIWSNQLGDLIFTALFIGMTIAVFFIRTRLHKKYGYYNNLLSGKMTILLTIISGIIFGKGLEILFRTLYIWSGAYGNVVIFSLNDIFISLSFGFSLLCIGSSLLFDKKLHEWLRLQTIGYDEINKIMTEIGKIVDKYNENNTDDAKMAGFKQIIGYIQTIMDIGKLKDVWNQEIIDKLKSIILEVNTIMNCLKEAVDESKKNEINEKMLRNLIQKLDRIKPEILNQFNKNKEPIIKAGKAAQKRADRAATVDELAAAEEV